MEQLVAAHLVTFLAFYASCLMTLILYTFSLWVFRHSL